MNKFKKIILGVVASAGVACLGGAVACSGEPDFYTLTFEGVGVEYIMQGDLGEPDANDRIFESGGKVKEGVEVRFSVIQSANAVGTPVITMNNVTITPDADGVYSFVISGDTTVSASGLNREYTLTLSKIEKVYSGGSIVDMERRIEYYGVDGALLGDEVKVEEGNSFSFILKASVYYLPGYNVCLGSEILTPDENGVYTLSAEDITGNNTINVTGIIEEDGFTAESRYQDCGNGTEENPFLISRPIDLYYVAALVNSSYSSYYATAHYKLMNDIDMDGEQLYVIGDSSTTTAVFCGTFDGNGHTVSNFYITDEVYDQQYFDKEYLPYVGLFGTASATEENPAVIKNLTLEDYTVTVHPGEAKSPSFVGTLVGYGVGVEITNCHLKGGEVLAIGDNNQMIFMGGFVGLLQSAYRADSSVLITHNAFVASCSADVVVDGLFSPRSAGGIVGNLVTADTGAIAYVVNCYSTGSVSGAMHTGGIVGSLGRFSTVSNCYSTASVSANNAINISGVMSEYKVAYAGGIVGYAESDSVVATCYAANSSLNAVSVHGASFQNSDDLVGGKAAAGELSVESAVAVLYNNLVKKAGDTSAVFTQQLGWLDSDWDFSGAMPEIKISDTTRTFRITIKNTAGNSIEEYSKGLESVIPMYNWYTMGGSPLPEYIAGGNKLRSFGYYFDKELTMKVPYGFVPTAAETVFYVGFADYSEVAGRYYLKATEYSSGVYFDLTEDGMVFLRDGGMYFSGTYSYDGNEITMYNSCFASLMYTMDEVSGGYFTVIGRKTENGFDFNGIAVLVDVENSTEDSISYVNKDINVSAVSELEGFAYGEYLDANGATYLFSKDGSGVYTSYNTRDTFTYEFEDDDELELTFAGGALRFAKVVDGVVTEINNLAVSLKNDFNGSWKKNSNSAISFEFDGLNGVVYTNGSDRQTATFEIVGNRAAWVIDTTQYEAYINQDGFLVINGEVYYLDDGFTGSWYMTGTNERVELTFEGIGKNGYGYATIMYTGGVVATIDAQYDIYTDADGSRLRIFVDDAQYGELIYNADNKTASGLFYSMQNEGYYTNARFYLYDSFRGSWVSVADGIDTVTFNGRTGDGTAEAVITQGKNTQRGTYVLTDGINGTMTVGGNTYTIKFEEEANRVTFALKGGEEDQLARRDSWYGVVLYEGDVSYTFDGKGYLGGTVSVSNDTTLAYTVSADGSVILGGEALVPTETGFTAGSKTLVFKTGFEGVWLVSGTQNTLTIGEVGGSFTATAEFEGGSGNKLTLVYDAAAGTLTHTEEINGERIITEYKLTGSFEMSISQRSTSGDVYLNCIRSENSDGWKGVYTAEDGATWALDGLGNAVYGSGSAIYTKDGISIKYSYKVNTLGLPYIRSDIAVVFTENADGEFTKDGKKYTTEIPDALYDRKVYVSNSDDDPEWYLFDGMGVLWLQNGDGYTQAYTYEIVSANEVVLTNAGGNQYTGKLTASGVNTRLVIEVA